MRRRELGSEFFPSLVNKKKPTFENVGNLFTNQNQIINNQFITLQRSYSFPFFAVKDLLLLCCSYVNIFCEIKTLLKEFLLIGLRNNQATAVLL